MSVQYIISDLDGTLVDTFEANFRAYQKVFSESGMTFSLDFYRSVFGKRVDELLAAAGMTPSPENIAEVKRAKAACYPEFFNFLKLNRPLYEFYRAFHRQGGHLAVATTASRINVERVLTHFNIADLFDFVIAGEDVKHGKPDPECYLLAAAKWHASPGEVLVFEDSSLGIEAAKNAGMTSIRIGEAFYGN